MAGATQMDHVSTEHLLNTISHSARALGLFTLTNGAVNGNVKAGGSAAQSGNQVDKSASETGSVDGDREKEANVAKARLLHACRALMATVSGPAETLKDMVLIDKHNLVSLQVINHYQIASLVPSEQEISMHDLALKCNLPSDILPRILRQAMTYGVFYEPRDGYVAHTALSREIPRLAPLLAYQLDICLPSTFSLIGWLKQHKEMSDEEHATSPFQIAHNTHDSWWSYAEKRPNLIENYGRYMALITKGGPFDVSHVVNGFAWAQLDKSLIIDIGGADGYVGSTIAATNPQLTVVVQDNAGLKESADSRIPPSLKNRVMFAAHSFFDPQEAIGSYADIFLLRHILHDWNDAACVKILRHLTACMKPTARIIVAESVLSKPGEVDAGTERVMRALDMQMMVQFGGKERTLDDWRELFQMADSRLGIVACIQPEGSADSLLELRLTGADAVQPSDKADN